MCIHIHVFPVFEIYDLFVLYCMFIMCYTNLCQRGNKEHIHVYMVFHYTPIFLRATRRQWEACRWPSGRAPHSVPKDEGVFNSIGVEISVSLKNMH